MTRRWTFYKAEVASEKQPQQSTIGPKILTIGSYSNTLTFPNSNTHKTEGDDDRKDIKERKKDDGSSWANMEDVAIRDVE